LPHRKADQLFGAHKVRVFFSAVVVGVNFPRWNASALAITPFPARLVNLPPLLEGVLRAEAFQLLDQLSDFHRALLLADPTG
jgi:hypothetical protein